MNKNQKQFLIHSSSLKTHPRFLFGRILFAVVFDLTAASPGLTICSALASAAVLCVASSFESAKIFCAAFTALLGLFFACAIFFCKFSKIFNYFVNYP